MIHHRSDRGNFLLAEALRLHSLGLSILPIGLRKKPAIPKWKEYQENAADKATICGWFKEPGIGLGIVLGPVSGDLVVRDFDTVEAYEAWKRAYPRLAAKLPTVRTMRGFHVYARILNCNTKRFKDGELRGAGSYVVAPPSEHPDGGMYVWVTPLVALDKAPLLNVGCTGFDREWGVTESRVCERVGRPVSVPVCEHVRKPIRAAALESPTVEDIPPECIKAIEQSLPTCEGTRNTMLFDLARRLKALPHCREKDPKELKPIVREWHRRALPFITTKDFDDTWFEFRNAWKNAKFPKWGIDEEEILREVDAGPHPHAALEYDNSNVRRLVKLCQVLQRHAGDEAFLLACRKAGTWLGIHYKRANKWLRLLAMDGVISVVTPGTKTKAARYRYHAD
jgi:hypothetical protein